MKLTEISNDSERMQMKLEAIKEWIHAHREIKKWKLTPDFKIIVTEGDVIAHNERDLPPAKLHQVAGSVDFSHSLDFITDFSLMPEVVGGDLVLEYCNIRSIQGAPKYVGGRLLLGSTKIESFQGIHKIIEHIGPVMYIPATTKSHLLGVLLIKQPPQVMIISASAGVDASRAVQAMHLLNSHLKSHIDVHEAQQELIDRGLEEFARL